MKKQKLLQSLILLSLIFFSASLFSQSGGVSISSEGTEPHESAGLDVNFDNKGFLPPRLSTEQRDLIIEPAEGLVIYNTDIKCLQFNFGTPLAPSWICTDGTNCQPEPYANAGEHQFLQDVTTTVLDANHPQPGETGYWEVISGQNGVVEEINNPNSIFNGMANETYTLRWSIQNLCGEVYSEISIAFEDQCPAIGDDFLGGKVAYLFPGEGCSGLIAAISDQSSGSEWGCQDSEIGNTSAEIGSGMQNTTEIVNGCFEPHFAAKVCQNHTEGVYSDWYLPSKDELNQLYLNKEVIGGFSNSSYWSSTENSTHWAWLQNFSNGVQDEWASKNNSLNVRCIRSF